MSSERRSAVKRRLEIVCGVLVLLLAESALLAGQDFADEAEESGSRSVDLSIPSEVIRGETFVSSVSFPDSVAASDVEGVTFALIDPDGTVHSRNIAFSVGNSGEAGEWRAIVGVPSTATVAQWELRARVQFTDHCMEVVEPFDVSAGDYRSMRIALNETLSELLTEPDPRREREREELRSLLGSAASDALYDYGPFEKPVAERRISATFGDRRVYVYPDGSESRSVHQGIDYAAQAGTEVRAAGHGRVRLAKERYMSGNTVVIEHLPGVYSLYYHLLSLEVERGDFVLRGTPIGTVGMTGLATGPHLHWEIRVAGVAVSPESFFRLSVFETRQEVPAAR